MIPSLGTITERRLAMKQTDGSSRRGTDPPAIYQKKADGSAGELSAPGMAFLVHMGKPKLAMDSLLVG